MPEAIGTKSSTDPARLYHRIRDAAYQPDPGLHAWLAVVDRQSWEALIWFVNQRYTPVDLYHHLQLTDSLAFVPQAEREFLEGCAELAAEQDEKFFIDIARMLASLRTQNITPILLKGAALISSKYYPQRGQRFVGDIDFAVQPRELDSALNALEQQGYKMELSLPRPISAYWRTKRDLPSMWHEEAFFRLECHIRPMDKALWRPPPFNSADLLEHAHGIEIAGGQVYIPCPEHLVVHAFYHAQLYDMYGLAGIDNYRAMIDVATIVARSGQDFNWPHVHELIGRIHAQKSFALFVERISFCVDSRALDWPVDRSNINIKKRVFEFFSYHPKIGSLLAAITVYARGVFQALSRAGRAERKVLFKANPDEVRFSPVWRQLFMPSIWTKRVRLIGRMAGIGH